ncbi:MAG: hypothetical protein HY231_13875 [Acidobacteria bacterium]|nr:hypothetical protein [Acidobacteriota bacterium]
MQIPIETVIDKTQLETFHQRALREANVQTDDAEFTRWQRIEALTGVMGTSLKMIEEANAKLNEQLPEAHRQMARQRLFDQRKALWDNLKELKSVTRKGELDAPWMQTN